MNDIERIRQQYEDLDCGPIFAYWERLSIKEKEQLIAQLQQIDWQQVKKQQMLLRSPPKEMHESIEPFLDYAYSGNENNRAEGKRRIEAGELGCLVLAGGQGTRLGSENPKGLYPISVIRQKSLFQLCAEKVIAAGKQAGRPLMVAIMTSPGNDAITRQFFIDNNLFGLDPEQLFFFVQDTFPFLDTQGNLFLEGPSHIAEGPDGNGFCLKKFVDSGIWGKWVTHGVKYLNLILIDNPLADPFDAELLGYHCREGAAVTLKCTEKTKPEEKVGVVVQGPKGCKVIEYSEFSDQERQALAADGGLKHRCANLSLFCFSMDFVKKAAKVNLPMHKAWKSTRALDQEGKAGKVNAWKFEAFVFDLLQEASVLLYPRERCFAPLKNLTGDSSPDTVRSALQNRDREVVEEVTHLKACDEPFELSAEFYYPTKPFLEKWLNKPIHGGYVE